ncbi:MAG: acyl-CoA dehydrogenase family protein [Nocardioides sp.]|jgi:alkylation response protein AidB-like acyl-CoA dehydrogenase
MKFSPTAEQADFVASLDKLLAGADTPGAARAWAGGNHEPGLTLWSRLAEQGVSALVIPEESGGFGATAVELVLAHEVLGRHVVPGPWIESSAYLARAATGELQEQVAEGLVATVAVPAVSAYALDADVAAQAYLSSAGSLSDLDTSALDEPTSAIDPVRRLFAVTSEPASDPLPDDPAFDLAALAASAQLLGLGEKILAETVAYALQRHQFGRAIGSYQAIKHQLADVRIALDFARPLVWGAALADGTAEFARAVSAAKVKAGDAAYLASRVGLQVHGAIGYTRELDLSLWLLRTRALVNAWGTPAQHRARILESLVAERG